MQNRYTESARPGMCFALDAPFVARQDGLASSRVEQEWYLTRLQMESEDGGWKDIDQQHALDF